MGDSMDDRKKEITPITTTTTQTSTITTTTSTTTSKITTTSTITTTTIAATTTTGLSLLSWINRSMVGRLVGLRDEWLIYC